MTSRLTERDIAMLQSLSTARFLTTPALEWLHFPTWRRRWSRYEAIAQRAQAPVCYKPSSRLYRRLQVLQRAGLIHRIVRPVSLSLVAFTREPNLYALSRQGADVLAAVLGLERERVWHEELRERSYLMLTHSSLIGTFYAALRAKIDLMPGVALEDWQGDHQLARAYDRLRLSVATGAGGTRRTIVAPVLPDATGVIRYPGGSMRCFVEIDRGRPVATWRDKIRAYEAYRGSPELRQRYKVDSFLLLTATTREGQRRRLMEATAEVVGGPSDHYLFCLTEDLHPLRIGAAWTRIAAAQPRSRFVVGRTVTSYRIEPVTHILLR